MVFMTVLFVILCNLLVCTAQSDSGLLRPKDCDDVWALGNDETGIYTIYPERMSGIPVRCDMDTEGGGWTVIQRQVSDSDFYKTWREYQIGFGDLYTNFWLGNKQISRLTSQNWYQLRIDMRDANGDYAYAAFDVFAVGDTVSKYELTVSGYHGNATDCLKYHNGRKFSTHDADNDASGSNCARRYLGGWWFGACHYSQLNGDYGNRAYGKGINWRGVTGLYTSLTFVEMKVKRWSPVLSLTEA